MVAVPVVQTAGFGYNPTFFCFGGKFMDFIGLGASTAWAQDAAAQNPALLSLSNPMFLMVAMLGVFYFLLIRPQQKRQKEHKTMLANLQKGDSIFTAGGIHGKVTGLTDTTVTIEIADKVRVKVNRTAIGGVMAKGETAAE
jgi:preprotein translocase subunit YajC